MSHDAPGSPLSSRLLAHLPLRLTSASLVSFFAILTVGTALTAYAVEDTDGAPDGGPVVATGPSTPGNGGSTASSPTAAASPSNKYRVTGTDGEALRLRDGPSLSANILARLPAGTIVTLLAGVAKQSDGERWLPVQADQQKGWVAARYLTRVVALTPVVRQLPADAPFGQHVAATAESLLGQPYVWGGSAPGGFDCSGFTQWVYAQNGIRMPRMIPEQLALGKPVDPADLQVGDLVAFQNTYQQGVSHVGVYVGNNKFVNSADEAQGVTASNLLDDYWKSRLYQAVRVRS